MSIFNNIAKSIAASSLSEKLGVPNPVSYIPATVSGTFVTIIMTVVLLQVFKLKDGVDETDEKTNITTKNVPKGYVIGIGVALVLGLVIGLLFYKFMWNMANPAYATASYGLNTMFNSN